MNKYTDDGNHIIDSTGKQWAVETPHLLPLPEGIERGKDICMPYGAIGSGYAILFGGINHWGIPQPAGDTHWLARRPLPPVPKPKTQEELDDEAAKEWERYQVVAINFKTKRDAFCAGAAYARKEAK